MSEDWLQQFEQTLNQLEQAAAKPESDFSTIMPITKDALGSLAAITNARLWLVRSEAVECLTDTAPPSAEDCEHVRKACRGEIPFTKLNDVTECLSISHSLADRTACVLQLNFQNLIAPRPSFIEGVTAVLEVLAAFVSRHLLSQYEAKLETQMALVSIVPRLHDCRTFREAASIVVHDGAPTLGNCRLSIVDCQTTPHQIIAITGVKDARQESETLRAIADLTKICKNTDHNTTNWHTLDSLSNDHLSYAQAILQRGGVQALRLIPISGEPIGSSLSADTRAVLVIETFDKEIRPPEPSVQQLLQATAPALTRLQNAERGLLVRFVSSRRLRMAAWMTLALLLLTFVPTTFEVEASGQLNSTQRRRIFAPDDGTIDEVLFQNEAEVESDATLLQMSNPDLELEQKRVQGEIETAATKLTAVQSRRLTDGDTALSGEEKQLELQIENLNLQLTLIEEQIATLTIKAPFAGTTFRRDASRDLLSRPVQRGQLLLEVVPHDSRWQLELKIPDRLRSYVVNHQRVSAAPPDVRYLIVSAPERDWTTSLDTIDNAIQVEDGTMVCRATAELTERPDTNLRPGTSVVARINCGRRSLGFVIFREVVEFWHYLRFAWL